SSAEPTADHRARSGAAPPGRDAAPGLPGGSARVGVGLHDRVGVVDLGHLRLAAGVGPADAGADLLLDPLAGVAVHALPVVEGALEHVAVHATEQVSRDGVDEVGPLL